VFPGAILAVATMPLVAALLDASGISIKTEYLFPLEAIAWGWLVVVCDMHIYMLFEGRRYWPDRIRQALIRRQRVRLEKLRNVQSNNNDRRRFLEAAVEIGQYPVDDGGDPYVSLPTRLGNIIDGFETYPSVKYGLDAVFYWFRLWVVLDKDLREEIDTAQAIVDSTVYISFTLYIAAILALIYAGFKCLIKAQWYIKSLLPTLAMLYVPTPSVLCGAAAGCIIISGLIYRLSLPAHAQFGELFKSIFDQYRSKLSFDDVIDEIGAVIGDPHLGQKTAREKHQMAWRFLRWHKIRDEVTQKNLTVNEWNARNGGKKRKATDV